MYGIYANIGGILMVNVTVYGSTMDPMGKPIILSGNQTRLENPLYLNYIFKPQTKWMVFQQTMFEDQGVTYVSGWSSTWGFPSMGVPQVDDL